MFLGGSISRLQHRVGGFFRRLNDFPLFDRSQWPLSEFFAKMLASLAVGAFVARRILQLPDFPGIITEVRWTETFFLKLSAFLPSFLATRPFDMERYYRFYGYSRHQIVVLWATQFLIWTVETGILSGYVVAFLTREKAQSLAKGFMETIFPLVLALLPFLIVMTDYTYRQWIPEYSHAHIKGLYAINFVLIVAGGFNLIGLFTMRRAFTIMSEARVLIRTGLFRWIRHPLYAAHFVIYFCYTLLHFHVLTVFLYVAFLVGQTLRARIEERKLASVFPEYEEYRRTTGMFFPRLFRGAVGF